MTHGVNVIKMFYSLSLMLLQNKPLIVPCEPFQASLMFAGKERSLLQRDLYLVILRPWVQT
jgi:hypothetical protein